MIDPVNGFSMADMPITESAMPLSFEQSEAAPSQGGGFMALLDEALGEVETARQESSAVTMDALMGKPVDIHDVMIAGAKSEVLTQLTSAVTNKVAQAYQTLANMQV